MSCNPPCPRHIVDPTLTGEACDVLPPEHVGRLCNLAREALAETAPESCDCAGCDMSRAVLALAAQVVLVTAERDEAHAWALRWKGSARALFADRGVAMAEAIILRNEVRARGLLAAERLGEILRLRAEVASLTATRATEPPQRTEGGRAAFAEVHDEHPVRWVEGSHGAFGAFDVETYAEQGLAAGMLAVRDAPADADGGIVVQIRAPGRTTAGPEQP